MDGDKLDVILVRGHISGGWHSLLLVICVICNVRNSKGMERKRKRGGGRWLKERGNEMKKGEKRWHHSLSERRK